MLGFLKLGGSQILCEQGKGYCWQLVGGAEGAMPPLKAAGISKH